MVTARARTGCLGPIGGASESTSRRCSSSRRRPGRAGRRGSAGGTARTCAGRPGAGGRSSVALGERRGDHDPGGAHLALDVAVLVEAPIDQVLVVGHGGVAGDHEPARCAAPRPRSPSRRASTGRALSSSCRQMALRIVERLAPGVGENGVQVTDLAQAVAPELERLWSCSPGPTRRCRRRCAGSGRSWDPGRARPSRRRTSGRRCRAACRVVVRHLVEHRALAVVEAEPDRPVLPAHPVAVDLEDAPSGWAISSGLMSSRSSCPGTRSGSYSPITRQADLAVVLDLQQLHGVHVDDRLEPGNRVGVGVPGRRRAHPDVRPAQPAVAPLLRHQRLPYVHTSIQHQIQVGEPAFGQRGDDPRVAFSAHLAVVPLVRR